MIINLVLHVAAGIGALWIAVYFIPGVEFQGSVKTLLIAGALIGVALALLKPILHVIAASFRILALGLVSFGIVRVSDMLFPELHISNLSALLWTTLAVWGISVILLFLARTKA